MGDDGGGDFGKGGGGGSLGGLLIEEEFGDLVPPLGNVLRGILENQERKRGK